jgi:hypothetical protein
MPSRWWVALAVALLTVPSVVPAQAQLPPLPIVNPPTVPLPTTGAVQEACAAEYYPRTVAVLPTIPVTVTGIRSWHEPSGSHLWGSRGSR